MVFSEIEFFKYKRCEYFFILNSNINNVNWRKNTKKLDIFQYQLNSTKTFFKNDPNNTHEKMLHSIFLKPLPFDFNSPSQQNKKIFFILHSINSEPNETDIQRIKTLANELIRKFKRKSDYLQLRQKRRKHVQSVKSLSKNIEVFFISKGACCKISVRIRQS